MTITRDEIRRVLGPVDDTLAADIVNTGANEQELAEAWAWVNSDEALINDGRPLPGGRVAELVALLVADEEEEDR
ncbi:MULTISPECIES: hypothetical protein [Pseudorhizobium]|uniref:Uncharacterized protein n=1 Tax=Pseudorhizobium pelagicum TaxID=1509405 RepID=A0A922P3J1_9HYPH|nr:MULTISPECIES: hypothetical protein [Pseudorhizobium]KEQ09355.1 hypothetical protein GV67_01425 [Pseudorhizobium pelagicum]KEQ10824.1 hypothetical protein GV68_00620 [Pseudorhizobium pelagicum]MBA4786248.1 hypothetical protein [Hyphomicrobiales bacterium]|tara:strand:+ start:451 stop:675 length:225 start_codon:yes stop_codon:yes gene_type:complete